MKFCEGGYRPLGLSGPGHCGALGPDWIVAQPMMSLQCFSWMSPLQGS